MSKDTHFFRIGLFVISAVALAVLAVVVLSSRELYKRSIPLETYINESVQGLEVGSPIKLRGVKIGQVSQIMFVDEAYKTSHRYVLVRANLLISRANLTSLQAMHENLQKEIKDGLRVRLASQGLTGTAFLEADYVDPARYPLLPIDWPPESLYVPSAPSVITQLSDSLQKILDKLGESHVEQLTHSVNELVTNVNLFVIGQLTPTLAGINEASKTLAASVSGLTDSTRDLMTNALPPILSNVRLASDSLPETMARLQLLVRRAESLMAEQQSTVEEMLGNVKAASRDLKHITGNARDYPAGLLLGEPPPEKGTKP